MTTDNTISPNPTAPKPAGKPGGVNSSFQKTEMYPETSSGEPLASPTPNEAAFALRWMGKSLGKYRIIDMLGQGGMGIVFKAHDPTIERDVAIKLLPDDVAADENALRRFKEEAKAAGKLNHPNVIAIYEISQEGATHFLAMELVTGGSAEDALVKHGAFSVLDATRMMIDACKGLTAAHAVGMVHRDIKPANLLRTADGTAKLTDFGLAKGLTARTQQLTQTGMVVGTPYFMSPEQCEARPLDARSDIYSLGATYYNLLTGKNPYEESDSIMQIMYAHCHGQVPDPRATNPAIPPACTAIIARAMAKAPTDRYQSAVQMQTDLEAVAATLSGHRGIELPSQSGQLLSMQQPVAAPAASVGTATWRRGALLGAGLSALVLLVALLLWRPWDHAGGDPNHPLIAPPKGEPILVGVLHSLTGTMADSEAVVVEATLFAIKEINDAGGLLGRPVKGIPRDGRSDGQVFARAAEKLITEDKVCTIFGCWTSESRKMVKNVVEKHNHLLVYPLQYEGLELSPNIFYMGAAPNQQILPAIDWAVKDLKKKRFFLVGSDYVFPHAANEIVKDYVKSLAAQVVGVGYLPLGSSKVAGLVAAIVKARPDMIVNTINGDSNVAFFRELRAAGITAKDVPCLSFSIGEDGLRSLDIADIQGDYTAWPYFQSIDTPANREFVERFCEQHPQRSVSDPTECAYVGVKMWARAVQDAGSLDPKNIRQFLRNQEFDAPGGRTRIDPGTQHTYKRPRIGRFNADGKFEIVWRAAELVAPEPYPSSRTAAVWNAFTHDLYMGWGNRWSAPAVK
ncbi:MAG: serine/threonine protein kinase [Planctomycetes bacterium]|nr:serine/threonine protein kinase [Planctomycetota bacterium]